MFEGYLAKQRLKEAHITGSDGAAGAHTDKKRSLQAKGSLAVDGGSPSDSRPKSPNRLGENIGSFSGAALSSSNSSSRRRSKRSAQNVKTEKKKKPMTLKAYHKALIAQDRLTLVTKLLTAKEQKLVKELHDDVAKVDEAHEALIEIESAMVRFAKHVLGEKNYQGLHDTERCVRASTDRIKIFDMNEVAFRTRAKGAAGGLQKVSAVFPGTPRNNLNLGRVAGSDDPAFLVPAGFLLAWAFLFRYRSSFDYRHARVSRTSVPPAKYQRN